MRALPFFVALTVFFSGVVWVVHQQNVESCERVNVVRAVLYDMLDNARQARARDGDIDTAAGHAIGQSRLSGVPHTDDPNMPAAVNCGEAFSLWPF